MKRFPKIVLTFFIALLTSGLFYASNSQDLGEAITTNSSQAENVLKCKYDQCHATAKSTGKRCKHCVSNKGDLYCWQHKD